MTPPSSAIGARATTVVATGVVLTLVLAAASPAAWALEVGVGDTADIDVDTDAVNEGNDAVLEPATPSDESGDEDDDADADEPGTTSDTTETVDSTVEETTGIEVTPASDADADGTIGDAAAAVEQTTEEVGGIEVDPASDDDPDASGTVSDAAETDESTNEIADKEIVDEGAGTEGQGALTGNENGYGDGDGADGDPETVDESDDRSEEGTVKAGGDEEATGEGSTGPVSQPASNQEPGAPVDLEPEAPVNPITPDSTTPAKRTVEAAGSDVRSVKAEDAGLSIADRAALTASEPRHDTGLRRNSGDGDHLAAPVAAATAKEPVVAGPAEAPQAAPFHVARLLAKAFGGAVSSGSAPAMLRVELVTSAIALLLVVTGAHAARFAEVRHRL